MVRQKYIPPIETWSDEDHAKYDYATWVCSQYRKKPVVIEALLCSQALRWANAKWTNLPGWLRRAYDAGDIQFAPDATHIRTLEGNMRADKDDWIICGVKGEIYPCKPDIFAATYEPVD